MSDLTTFLLERITEDETVARKATPVSWAIVDPPADSVSLETIVGTGLAYNRDAARHIVRWDPDRVLAECEAKRRILAHCGSGLAYGSFGESLLGETVLRLIALPYADHPDYQEDWRL